MNVGFTGTRDGLTCEQHRALCEWVKVNPAAELHHGCCIGADSEAFDVFHTHSPGVRIVAHPPTNRAMVSGNAMEFSDEKRLPAAYLERNKNIVRAAGVLVACPKGPEEVRSGTWSTIRFARREGKQLVIIWPDGSITNEGA